MNKNNMYVISITFTVAIGGFLLGFDGSVISGAMLFYKTVFHLKAEPVLLGFSVSCIIAGTIIGNMAEEPLSDKIGRNPTLLLSAIMYIATGIICALSGNVTQFIIGRIIGGIGVGIAILIEPIYIAEIDPAAKRGWLVSFNQLLIVIGLSSAYFSNYFILKFIQDPLTNRRFHVFHFMVYPEICSGNKREIIRITGKRIN